MAALIGCLDVLESERLPSTTRYLLAKLRSEAAQIADALGLDDVAIISRPAREESLNDLVTKAVSLLRLRRPRQARDLQLRLAESSPRVKIGRGDLNVALVNLVLNAWEASPVGAAVEISTGTAGDTAFVRVADQGSGVPESLRDKFFEPRVTSRPDDHDGLGLSFACEAVARAGGELVLVETGDLGSVFAIHLPTS